MKHAYVVATVVGRTAPVSSHLGDRAIVRADGRVEGFIGGACSRDIVRRQALEALRTGKPRLVRIRPGIQEAREDADAVTVPMNCVSEGAIDVYVHPHLPKRKLLIAGFTPVAHALAQIAPALDFDVARFVDAHELAEFGSGDEAAHDLDALDAYLQHLESDEMARVVGIAASLGHYDERALAAFLNCGAGFVGLVASPKRAAAVAGALVQEGLPQERVSAIHTPVGLAIGARKPAEVAISIFAEIIEVAYQPGAAPAAAMTVDPVCGMTLEIDGAQHRYEFQGERYFFCCAQCRASFAGNPEQYLAAAAP